MQVKQVSKADIENCVKVVNALKVGKFEVSGPDLVALSDAIRWLANTAALLSKAYQDEAKPASASISPAEVKKTAEMGKSKKLNPKKK